MSHLVGERHNRPTGALVAFLIAGCQGSLRPPDDVRLDEFEFANRRPWQQDAPTSKHAFELLKTQLSFGESLSQVTVMELPYSQHYLLQGVAASSHESRVVAAWEDGAPQPAAVLLMAERANRYYQSGKLGRTLLEISQSQPVVEVIILVNASAVPPIDFNHYRNTEIDVEDAIAAERERLLANLRDVRAPLRQFLEAHGASDITELDGLPALRARVPSVILRSREFNERADLIGCDIPSPPQPYYGYAGHAALGELAMHDGANCAGYCDGAALGVTIWEEDPTKAYNLAVANQRFFYHSVTAAQAGVACTSDSDCPSISTPNAFCLGGFCRTEHGSTVAAAVGMFGAFTQSTAFEPMYEFPKAGAYKIDLKYANLSNHIDGLSWASTQNVLYINRSQGTGGSEPTSSSSALIDWVVRDRAVTLTVAAGNGGDSFGDSADCGGWNTVCVGAAFYKAWSNRSDDEVAPYSSWRNRSTFGFPEWPHVVAMGGPNTGLQLPNVCRTDGAMTTKTCSGPGFASLIGTSYAAPAVLGSVLLSHQYAGWFFDFSKPQMRKIALMVSSTDANADGPVPIPGIDSRDGAGMPNLENLYRMINQGTYRTKFIVPSDVENGSAVWVADVYLAGQMNGAREALRVGMAWNSCAMTGSNTNTLPDFDLVLVRPSLCFGVGLVQGNRINSEYELLYDQCLAPGVSGNYQIYIIKKPGTPFSLCGSEADEPIAVAWDIVTQ